jgi:hypothetical protein
MAEWNRRATVVEEGEEVDGECRSTRINTTLPPSTRSSSQDTNMICTSQEEASGRRPEVSR